MKEDRIFASDLVTKLQALIEDRGDLPVELTITDENGNSAIAEFSFTPSDRFWEGQSTNRAFIFHLYFKNTLNTVPGIVRRKKR